MYFFVVIFALVSLIQDEKIKTALSNSYNKTRKRFYKRVKKDSKHMDRIKEDYDQKFFGRNGFLHSFINGCLSIESREEIWEMLHEYN